MKVLSLICARAGSKGVKNKCIRKIGHKLVFEFSIEYSLSLGKEVKTVVSSDIKKILDYCEKENIELINRKSELCSDNSRIEGTLADAIIKKGEGIGYCSLVYGNIPTRHADLFYESLDFLEQNKDYDAVISMQEASKFHPDWMFDYNEEILPKKKETHYRRQMLNQQMYCDGHTLIFRINKFLEKYNSMTDNNREYIFSIYGEKIKPILNDKIIIDIDSEKDLKMANCVIK